jgi:DNA polymerase elongation subunit (family B)
MKSNFPRILIVDIETSPIISYTWGLFDQNVALNQVVEDWHLLSYSAKFLNEKKVYYKDQSKAKNISNDKPLLEDLWNLLDASDIVIGQNSTSFDIKRIKARMLIHGMQPPSSFKQIDTMRIAKKYFNFTSNKLEYLSKKLCKKHKKLTHKKFPGFELWKECLKGNKAAWAEMKKYNIQDILATEELYNKLQPWDSSINFNVYSDSVENVCACGSTSFIKKGYKFTSVGKYQRYKCTKCGSEAKSRTNLLDKEKSKTLLIPNN